jgi:hypothetical protein
VMPTPLASCAFSSSSRGISTVILRAVSMFGLLYHIQYQY